MLVVTNKHVLAGCDYARLVVSTVPQEADLDRPIPASELRQHTLEVDLKPGVHISHPSAAVDLCAVNVSFGLHELIRTQPGRVAYAAFLTPAMRPSDADRKLLRYMEPVAMVGYPRGLWDHVNDMPIIRMGSTATHPLHRYQGRSEFVIDMACFPGSSGSPVFLYEDGLYRDEGGGLAPGTKFRFLGVLWGGPEIDKGGRIEVQPIPHSCMPVPVVSLPLNLGFVVSSDELDPLEQEAIKPYALG